MKYLNSLMLSLFFLVSVGCSDSVETEDPLVVALQLNEENESQFISSAQDVERSQIALAYFRIQQPEKAQNVITQIENLHKKIWVMSHGAVILNEFEEKLLSEKLITEALLLASKATFSEDQDNDLTYEVLLEALGKLKKYDEANSLIQKFKKPDIAVISIDRVARNAIALKQNEVAKTFLDQGVAYGKEYLNSSPQLSKSLQFLAWGYFEIGELKKARELLKMLVVHDMNRKLGEYEKINYVFSSYDQKLLMTEQYDLAIEVSEHIKRELQKSSQQSSMILSYLNIQNADIAVIHALKDEGDLSNSFRLMDQITDSYTRILGYKSAAKHLQKKGRSEDAALMLLRAKKEIVSSEKSDYIVNQAILLASDFLNIDSHNETTELIEWAAQNVENFNVDKRVSSWIRIIRIYEKMGNRDASNKLLQKADNAMAMMEDGNSKDRLVSDISEVYCTRGDEVACKAGLVKLSDPSKKTEVLRLLVELSRGEGRFEEALSYISEMGHRGTVIQNLRFVAQDMYKREEKLSNDGLVFLSEIADKGYE